MKTFLTVASAMITGAAIGGFAVQGLHAQAKPPVYYVAQIDVTNEEAYAKDYVPKAQALIKSSGGKFVAIGGAAGGGKVTVFDGDPPKKRVVIQVWDSLEKIQAWRNSAEFKEVRKIGEPIAKFHAYAVDGVPQ